MLDETNSTEPVELQPTWKNAPTAIKLRDDLKEASSIHSAQAAKIGVWLDNLNVEGNAKIKGGVGRSTIQPMLIRKHAEWRYASLSEPLHTAATLFTVKPVSGEDGPIAKQNGAILNHQFENEIDKIGLIDEAVRTAVDEGTIIYRIGWDLKTEKQEIDVDVVSLGDIVGSIKQEQEVTIVSRPTVEIVPFKSFLLDPNARGNIKDAQFAIYQFPTNISKLKAQGYQNLDSINVQSMSQDDSDNFGGDRHPTEFNFKDSARKEFTAYEYWGFWDINDDHVLVPIVATFVNNVMIKLDENPFPDGGLPFVITQYLPVRKANYGEPDGALLIDNQKIMGALTRSMLDTIGRSAAGQKGYMDQALDAANELKFHRGEDYKFRAGTDPRKIMHDHNYPELSSTGFNLLQANSTEAESMTGVKAYGEGITGSSLGDTAAGANGALSAAAKRESGILRRIAKGFTDVAKKIAIMNEVFLEQAQVERITGEAYVQPQPGVVTIDIQVKIRTAEEDAQLANDMAFVAQTTEDPGLRQLLTSKVAELKNMPEEARMIREYQPEPDPMQQKMQELQIQLLEAQVTNELGKAHENEANGMLDTAKAQTELAKAANLAADTNLKQLEYVEEETGTNHERARDLQQQQAMGNMQLKGLESQLNNLDEGT